MKPTVRIARVAGVSVGAHWSTLVVLALFGVVLATVELPATAPGYPPAAYWVAAFALAAVFLASVLVHELAHAAVARRHGVAVEGITLWLLGGVAEFHEHAHDPTAELRIAVAGPAATVAVGAASGAVAVTLYCTGAPGLLVAAFGWLATVSVVLAVFNLLPGAPLDGGRVLAAVLWRRSGDERGSRRRAARSGQTIGQVLIGIGILDLFVGAGVGGLWLILLGWFLIGAARGEEADLDVRGALVGVRVLDVMTPDPAVVHQGMSIAELLAAQALHTRGSSFPIVDDTGTATGLVTLHRIRAVAPDRWATTTVDEVAFPRDGLRTAAPDEQLRGPFHVLR
jgi:Zn-dependent protease